MDLDKTKELKIVIEAQKETIRILRAVIGTLEARIQVTKDRLEMALASQMRPWYWIAPFLLGMALACVVYLGIQKL